MIYLEHIIIAFIIKNNGIERSQLYNSLKLNYSKINDIDITFDQLYFSYKNLIDSNQIEEDTINEECNIIKVHSNHKVRSVENMLRGKSNEEMNDIKNLNRIMNHIIINKITTIDDIENKYFNNHFVGSPLIPEADFKLYSMFLEDKNCIKISRIDNYNFKIEPLDHHISVFNEFALFKEDKITNKKNLEIEENQEAKSSFLKNISIILILFVVLFMLMCMVAFIEKSYPLIFPILILGYAFYKMLTKNSLT
jgi:hypothetical protein